MKITFLMVGKTDFPFVKEGVALYEKRITRYVTYSHVEIPELKGTSSLTPQQIKEKEQELIFKHIKDGDRVVLLDEKGESFGSVEWARHLGKTISSGVKSMVFVVGGAYGFSDGVYKRCDERISFSKMTFSHQIIRLFFAEQLYRAFTIIKGEPYHNE